MVWLTKQDVERDRFNGKWGRRSNFGQRHVASFLSPSPAFERL